ncbi:hypothetical protein HC028_04175 [Planosporangium flavigriseum]|nr:hypothetical protein [Planosporangium flavigriseum]
MDGKTFASISNTASGEVDGATRFRYRQDGETIWADYGGGAIVRGYLVGTRTLDRLDFRYVHLNTSGETASGRCTSRMVVLPDGRVRMHEAWSWESRQGSGESLIEEVRQER